MCEESHCLIVHFALGQSTFDSRSFQSNGSSIGSFEMSNGSSIGSFEMSASVRILICVGAGGDCTFGVHSQLCDSRGSLCFRSLWKRGGGDLLPSSPSQVTPSASGWSRGEQRSKSPWFDAHRLRVHSLVWSLKGAWGAGRGHSLRVPRHFRFRVSSSLRSSRALLQCIHPPGRRQVAGPGMSSAALKFLWLHCSPPSITSRVRA